MASGTFLFPLIRNKISVEYPIKSDPPDLNETDREIIEKLARSYLKNVALREAFDENANEIEAELEKRLGPKFVSILLWQKEKKIRRSSWYDFDIEALRTTLESLESSDIFQDCVALGIPGRVVLPTTDEDRDETINNFLEEMERRGIKYEPFKRSKLEPILYVRELGQKCLERKLPKLEGVKKRHNRYNIYKITNPQKKQRAKPKK